LDLSCLAETFEVKRAISPFGRGPFAGEGAKAVSDNEAKIQRWQRYIDECRQEAKFLSPEGQQTMQTVIESYEKLIAMAREQDKKTR
jgi:hypothetical protein